MDTIPDAPHERLVLSIKEAGLNGSRIAALLGEPRQAIHKLTKGQTKMTLAWANRLAKHLPHSAAFLMGLDGVQTGAEIRLLAFDGDLPPNRPKAALIDEIILPELDVRARGGSGAPQPDLVAEGGHGVVAYWRMPANYLSANSTDPGAIRIIRVSGESMEPDYPANERVMVDTSHHAPSPDGVYVIWDGYGLTLKRLQLLPDADQPRVRLSSINPAYEPYELPVERVQINGRVIGKWTWK